MNKANLATTLKRTVASLLFVLMLLQAFPVVLADEVSKVVSDPTYNSLAETAEVLTATTYEEYLVRNEAVEAANAEFTVPAVDYDAERTTADVVVVNDAGGLLPTSTIIDGNIKGKSLIIPDTGRVYWKINVPKTGMYNIDVTYYPFDNVFFDGKGDVIKPINEGTLEERENLVAQYKTKYDYRSGNTAGIERIFMIDDEVPFKEARYLTFSRIWKDDYLEPGKRVFDTDITGNELKPTKYESPEWTVAHFEDSSAFYSDPFEFFFEEGEHVIALDSSREPIMINSFRFYSADKAKTYAEVKAEYEKKGYKDVSEEAVVTIEAEAPSATSEQVIYAVNDRTSAITSPQDPAVVLLNSIGGEKWELVGQWVSWEFTAPETGLYEIVPRFKQSIYAGMFASRGLKINGEYPFDEAKRLKFNFSDNWQTKPLGNDEEGYKFYFEEGKTYELQFQVVLGDMSKIIMRVEESLTRMNEYYRKILMITGPEPDANISYDFARLIPEVLRGLRSEAELLYEVSAELEQIIGEKGENTVLLDKIAYIIDIMGHDQDKVASNLSNLKSNIGSLATWLFQARNQPLQFDYITVQSADKKLPRSEGNFFESFWYEIRSFIMSFYADYNSLGSKDKVDTKDNTVLEVWITEGREQASIHRQMVSEFTQEYGIPVNIKLVAAGTLLPATLAGVGPDVSTDADAVSFGVRNAVANLNERDPETGEHIYPDFEELQSWFSPAAFTPLTVYNPDATDEYNKEAIYGIPVTQAFPMFFYRKDIFIELGLKVPETWDEIYTMIRVLSENNMEMGLLNIMGALIFQRGEPYYKGEGVEWVGMATNLDSNVSLDCFKKYCEFFTLYGQPYTYDFANRFRTGEMPAGIADYSLYNQLTVFAPEIKGLWEMTRIPGTLQEDGTVNHIANTTVTSIMIMRDAYDRQQAWQYIKWWVSAESQERFGKEQVATMGAAAKYFTANIEALKAQPWSAQEIKNIDQQFQSLQGLPMTPGNYIVTRDTQFAFLSVYNENANPTEQMLSYIQDMNKEISRKREEYDFPTLEDYKELHPED